MFGSQATVTCYTSDSSIRMECSTPHFKSEPKAEFGLVKVYPTHTHQSVIGFGGAFTQAAAKTYAGLSPENKDAFLAHCFGKDGCAYNLVRTSIQSCDFSDHTYEYVTDKNDTDLATFKLDAADTDQIIPAVLDALKTNPDLEVLASPWSPPAFMKSNKVRGHGGSLKERDYDFWAAIMARYAREVRAAGVPLTRMTIQNEPNAKVPWDSCLYDPQEELEFARHLRRSLDGAGLSDMKLILWDHNKDRIIERVSGISDGLDMSEEESLIAGYAFHWYTGDHFEAVNEVASRHPLSEILLSEMCLGFHEDSSNDVDSAERYAHEIIGDFNAGAQAFIDWNILLDVQGGPNHTENFCNSPLMATSDGTGFDVGLESIYIEHFSRFVQRGARRMVVSRESGTVEAVGFVNPDDTRVVVVLNPSGDSYGLDLAEFEQVLHYDMAPHSIATFIWGQ